MKRFYLLRITRIASPIFAALALDLPTSTPFIAQQSGSKPSPNRPSFYPSPTGADVDRMERDRQLRDLDTLDKVTSKAKPKSNERDRETALRLATEDFQHLLEINQQPFAPVVGALDYKRVFETISEVEKRSTRLRSNLVLPVIVADKKKKLPEEMDDERLRVSLAQLQQLIRSFVTNPVFYGNGSIDTKLQMQAARDLDGVIELSGKIGKRVAKSN